MASYFLSTSTFAFHHPDIVSPCSLPSPFSVLSVQALLKSLILLIFSFSIIFLLSLRIRSCLLATAQLFDGPRNKMSQFSIIVLRSKSNGLESDIQLLSVSWRPSNLLWHLHHKLVIFFFFFQRRNIFPQAYHRTWCFLTPCLFPFYHDLPHVWHHTWLPKSPYQCRP